MAKEHIEKIGKNATARDINEMYDNGKIYYGSNPEMAMLYFERVVKDKPEASNYLAEYYYEQKGDIENATKYYLIAAKNGDKDSLNDLQLLYFERGNDKETKKILKELDEKDTENDFLIRKASFFKTKERYDKSLEIYDNLIKKGEVEGYTEKGVLFYENLGKKEEGKKVLEKAVNKGSSTAAFELGAKYLIEKNYKEARKHYLIRLEKRKKDERATSTVGYCYEMEGNYEEAKKWYKKAVDLGEKEFASERLQDIGNK
jgi:tetratricopeptide repeat protein